MQPPEWGRENMGGRCNHTETQIILSNGWQPSD